MRLPMSLAFVATTALTGCPDRTISAVPPQQQGAILKAIPFDTNIDLLFVIDNSASTADKQTLFASNFQRFIDTLQTSFTGGLPNLHVGVIDTTIDIGVPGYSSDGRTGCPSPNTVDDGRLQHAPHVPGCQPPNGAYIEDIATSSGRSTNFTGTLADTFSCVAQLGADGCGFEAPLEAMRRALDGPRSENAGFLRDGAYLAVVILTDEDDASVRDPSVFSLDDTTVGGRDDFRVQPLYAYTCDQAITLDPGAYTGCKVRRDSYLEDPAVYAQFLSTIKNPALTLVAVIASPPPGVHTDDTPAQTANINADAIRTGPLAINGSTQPMALQPSTTCTIPTATGTDTAIGRPALRLVDFLGNFADRGRFYNVCQSDYSAALTDIGNTLQIDFSPCLEGPIASPLDCTVTDVQHAGTSAEAQQGVIACPMTNGLPTPGGPRPCWYGDQNPAACPAPASGWEVHVARDAAPPATTVTQIECATVPQ